MTIIVLLSSLVFSAPDISELEVVVYSYMTIGLFVFAALTTVRQLWKGIDLDQGARVKMPIPS